MKNFIVILIFLSSISLYAQTFTTFPGTSISIGNTPYNTSLTVSGIGTIGCVIGLDQVCVDITHSSDDDLDLYLIDPQGVQYTLSTDNGGSGNNYQTTCFDMSAVINITAGTAPFNGSYLPEGDFSSVNNDQNGDGIWQLRVNDDGGGNNGTLNSFSLIFAPLVECLPIVVEDCRGATTICSDVSFSGNASGSGYITDLNSSNRGCLTSNEHESSWYYFEAQTNGTIEMTIITGVDYDFAIWGHLFNYYSLSTGWKSHKMFILWSRW